METIKFSIFGRPMTCGQSELTSRQYKKIVGKRGNWYVAIQENAADNVYFASRSKERSDGFGGATLSFLLEDGTIDKVQGPWHSNSDSLFEDTGYDIRNQYFTQGIIAKTEVCSKMGQEEYTDVLHYDEVGVLGKFKRIEDLAQELANKHNCKVYYAVKSSGGGSKYFKEPQNI